MDSLTDKQIKNFTQEIQLATESLGLNISEEKIEQLLAYLALFIKWNKAYNLSAIRDPQEMLKKHLIDSLSIFPQFEDHPEVTKAIDVGTGGGLPGIPLAICYPERQFTLLDSAGKKIRFLHQVKQNLQLKNLTLVNMRVEQYTEHQDFDVVTSRAFSSLKDFTRLCRHLLKDGGKFWAMKGVFPQEEIEQLDAEFTVEATSDLVVPGIDAERCLIVLAENKA